MVRLHGDVDGCGCFRCQEIEHEVIQRSLTGALSWSAQLPLSWPSILVVLGAVGLLQAATAFVPSEAGLVVVCAGIVGVFAGRGYIGVVGRRSLDPTDQQADSALRVVVGRLPQFVGAVLAIVSGLVAVGLLIVLLLSPVVQWGTTAVGVDPMVADLGILGILVVSVVYALLKCCFVPEACFVGGYGPLDAIRVSWTITSVHTAKAVAIFGGFSVLLAVGVLFETQLGGAGAPLALTIEVGETEVVLRSFGLSVASGLRFAFDLLVTALYSGVFVHQYVSGVFQAGEEERDGDAARGPRDGPA